MKIGSINEAQNIEKRISITPEIAKKYCDLGIEVFVNENYGKHLGISDDEYKKLGVKILKSRNEVLQIVDVSLFVNVPSVEQINLFKKDASVIGTLNPHKNKEILKQLILKNIKIFSLDFLPRITRAQSMDVLSSQANLAGYRAVIESVNEFNQAIPMMMTAAGTIPAAKFLVIGAGVAGLQAIATAKRLGGIVFATDVRTATKEQVESLGGRFLSVKDSANMETESGYAKEVGENFKLKQEELLKKTLVKINIVICTALTPGKKAPRILNEDMIQNMQPGSIIYDLAVDQGGNSAFSELDKLNEVNGIKIIGYKNILNKLPLSASSLYARNLLNFFLNLYSKEKNNININLDDEIIKKTFIQNVDF